MIDFEITAEPWIIMLCGLPGSGKSTWVKKFLASREGKHKQTTVLASTDAIIEKWAAEQNLTYDELFHTAIKPATKEMNNAVNHAIAMGYNIVWDQTNLNKASRQKKLGMLPPNYSKFCVWFEVEEMELRQRLKNRSIMTGKTISGKIIAQMRTSIQEPELTEGFDIIQRLYDNGN